MTKQKKLKDKTYNELIQESPGKTQSKKILNLMARLSLDDSMSESERERFYKKVILPNKIKIDLSARNIQKASHEFLNAASTTLFGMKTALGLTDMERMAAGIDDTEKTIDELIIQQRIPTKEYVCRPRKIKYLSKKSQQLFYDSDDDSGYDSDVEEQYVFHGHIGSATAGKPKKSKNQFIVTEEAAPRSGFHQEQLDAQEESTHHLSLSYRLSKITDAHQIRGRHVIRAFKKSGFHPNSFFNEYRIKTRKDALKVAILAEFNYKKRQTQEKYLRAEYEVLSNLSETYSEISTDSETFSDKFDEFKVRKKKEEPFRSFIKGN